MSFFKKLASNEKLVDKVFDQGSKMFGDKLGMRSETTEKPTEQWSSPQSSTGKKRALFIGINYFGQKGELRGCINDVENIAEFIFGKCGFPKENSRILTDDQKDQSKQPTRQNILDGMKWLVEGAKEGDVLFLHYSGHGASVKDTDGDEGDGNDETICPVDYAKAGMIIDDEMHGIMLRNLPSGVKFISIFDCCHSGSILDLPFTYSIDGNLVIHERDNRIEGAKKLLKAGIAFAGGKNGEAMRGLIDGVKTLSTSGQKSSEGAVAGAKVEDKTTKADVVQFSGCRDDQTSADATIGGEATGAMSHAFIQALEKHGHKVTYKDLLKTTREILHGKYSQVPQLSAGKQLNMDVYFEL